MPHMSATMWSALSTIVRRSIIAVCAIALAVPAAAQLPRLGANPTAEVCRYFGVFPPLDDIRTVVMRRAGDTLVYGVTYADGRTKDYRYAGDTLTAMQAYLTTYEDLVGADKGQYNADKRFAPIRRTVRPMRSWDTEPARPIVVACADGRTIRGQFVALAEDRIVVDTSMVVFDPVRPTLSTALLGIAVVDIDGVARHVDDDMERVRSDTAMLRAGLADIGLRPVYVRGVAPEVVAAPLLAVAGRDDRAADLATRSSRPYARPWIVSARTGLTMSTLAPTITLTTSDGGGVAYAGPAMTHQFTVRATHDVGGDLAVGVGVDVAVEPPSVGWRTGEAGEQGMRWGMDAVVVQAIGTYRLTEIDASAFSFTATAGAGVAMTTERQRTWWLRGAVTTLDNTTERSATVPSFMVQATAEYAMTRTLLLTLSAGMDGVLWPALSPERYAFLYRGDLVSMRIERPGGIAVRPTFQMGVAYRF